MQDKDKTKHQLIGELADLRRRLRMLEESEENYRLIVETANEGIWIVDENNNVEIVNDKMAEMLGCTRAEIIGRPVFDFLDEEGTAISRASLKRRRQGISEQFDLKFRRKDGSDLYTIVSATPILYKDGRYRGALAMITDITLRKVAEEALLLSEERFYKVFNASPGLLVITTLDGRYIDVNSNFLRTTGYSREEVIGRTALELGLYVDPEVRLRGAPEFIRQGLIYNQEVHYRMKSGEVRVGMSSAELIELGGEQCVLAIVIDVTEKKQLEKELARLERLNLVSEMAAGIGHEIRNPMTAVRGFLQMLAGKEDCARYRDFYELMIDELDRANSIVTEFLSLARNKPVDLKLQNLNAIIKVLYPMIQADAMSVNKSVTMELDDVPVLLLDEREIRQLILNLVRNGLEAMEQGGNLTIKTYTGNNEVTLSVRDQGKGIRPDLIEKIGTPFFTTKEKGTGLGLAVCYGIAARHKAAITMETASSGTTFYVGFKMA